MDSNVPTSSKFSLNKQDLKKIGKGALIAIGGALLTYLASFIANTDFGSWTPIVFAVSSALINAGKQFLSGESNQ